LICAILYLFLFFPPPFVVIVVVLFKIMSALYSTQVLTYCLLLGVVSLNGLIRAVNEVTSLQLQLQGAFKGLVPCRGVDDS
jgi:hypothetical protein